LRPFESVPVYEEMVRRLAQRPSSPPPFHPKYLRAFPPEVPLSVNLGRNLSSMSAIFDFNKRFLIFSSPALIARLLGLLPLVNDTLLNLF